jgi:hypothetical protein
MTVAIGWSCGRHVAAGQRPRGGFGAAEKERVNRANHSAAERFTPTAPQPREQRYVSRYPPTSLSLRRSDVFPPMAVSMINVGEQTGGLDEMLSKIADS